MEYQLNLSIVAGQLEKKKAPYRVEHTIGTGSFGTVVKAHVAKSKEPVAIKFVHASKMHEYICSEVRNHRLLRHPHVVRFHRVLEVGGHLAIAMEYANGSSLFQAVKKHRKFSEPLARWIFQQLILAVDYCHKKGVASENIKCENVLLVRHEHLPIVKLSDNTYRNSTSPVGKHARAVVGHADYVAPEALSGQDSASFDSKKVDVWACGVVLYVMLSGHYPFTRKHIPRGNTEGLKAVRQKIADCDYKLPNQLSGSVCSLIKRILTTSDKRLTVEQIMEHPWFLHDFPEEAHTLNADLLEAEKVNMKGVSQSNDWQSDEDIEHEVLRVGCYDKMKRPFELYTDSVIDAEIDADFQKYPESSTKSRRTY